MRTLKHTVSLGILSIFLSTSMSHGMSVLEIVASEAPSGVHGYLFATQVNESCPYVSVYNLRLLTEGQPRYPFSQLEWLMRTFENMRDVALLEQKLLNKDGGAYRQFYKYMHENGVEEGGYYTEHKTSFADTLEDDMERLQLKGAPYHMKKAHFPTHVTAPFLYNPRHKAHYIIDPALKKFVPVETVEDYNSVTDMALQNIRDCYGEDGTFDENKETSATLFIRLTKSQQDYFAKDKAIIAGGMPRFGSYLYDLKYATTSDDEMQLYDVGTYQKMLIVAGAIPKDPPLQDVHCEFQEALTRYPAHPWNHLKAESFFEARLAQTFRDSPELKQVADKVIDFALTPWAMYKKSLTAYTKSGQKVSELAYVPDEDAMLAYYFSGQLRLLWGISIGYDLLLM